MNRNHTEVSQEEERLETPQLLDFTPRSLSQQKMHLRPFDLLPLTSPVGSKLSLKLLPLALGLLPTQAILQILTLLCWSPYL